MANSVSYVSYTHSPSSPQDLESRFSITFSGSYVSGSGNGETINLNAASNPNGLEMNGALPATTLPEGFPDVLLANFESFAVLLTAYSAGEFTVRFFLADTELASGAYPAQITAGQLNVAVRARV